MDFIFRDKHATGEFTVLQAPYDRVSASDKDFIVIRMALTLRLIPQHNMILIVSRVTAIMKAPLQSVLEVESGTKVRGSSVTIVLSWR